MVAENTTAINTALLAELAGRAITTYPASAASIRKAHAMVLTGAVTLTERGAFVESASQPGTYYHVRGKSCTCPARTPLCCHRFAVSLVRHLQAEESLPAPAPPARPPRYYAYLSGHHDVILEAERQPDGCFTLYHQGVPLATTVMAENLTLLGDVALSDQQRREDGNLAKKVCRL